MVEVAARAPTVSVRVAVAGTFASVAAAVVDIFEFTTVGSFVAWKSVRAVGTAAVMVVHIAKELAAAALAGEIRRELWATSCHCCC